MSMSVDVGASSPFEILRLGEIPYLEAWELQKALLEKRIAGSIPDTLIACTHPPVITLGRGSQREGPGTAPSLCTDIPTVEIERGGLATYHGPGQVVIYPIVYLSPSKDSQVKGGVVGLIRKMEEAMITYLAREHGLVGRRVEGATGVWIANRKIASIGIAVRKWVSYHGLAFNVSTAQEAWSSFNPCGFSPEVMTNLELECGEPCDLAEVQEALLAELQIALLADGAADFSAGAASTLLSSAGLEAASEA